MSKDSMGEDIVSAATGTNGGADQSRKNEFRGYLEKSGLMDALTMVMVALYEEKQKPDNALEYVSSYLTAAESSSRSSSKTTKGNQEAEDPLTALRQENAELRQRLAELTKNFKAEGK